jgi:predicted NBD/HSP70 family sugar kinase
MPLLRKMVSLLKAAGRFAVIGIILTSFALPHFHHDHEADCVERLTIPVMSEQDCTLCVLAETHRGVNRADSTFVYFLPQLQTRIEMPVFFKRYSPTLFKLQMRAPPSSIFI